MCKNIISALILIYLPIRNFIPCSPEVHYTILTFRYFEDSNERCCNDYQQLSERDLRTWGIKPKTSMPQVLYMKQRVNPHLAQRACVHSPLLCHLFLSKEPPSCAI